jgi:prepilin peptidase CpaA
MIVTTLALLIFPLLMLFAAFSDLFTMRISNVLILLVAASFFPLALIVQMPLDVVLSHVTCAAAVLVVAFAFFAVGWIGGGDAKLAAATALWLGFGLMLPYLVYSGLLGGAVTLFILAVRRWPLPGALQRVAWVDRLHDRREGVPYGIALAAAGLLVYPDTTIFRFFVA